MMGRTTLSRLLPALWSGIALLALYSMGVAAERDPLDSKLTSRPNIVVIYADDLGYGDVQCYNPSRGKIATPHMDALAAAGMRFTDAHSSSGVCSPSRYTLLTGRYHWRTRLQRGIVGLWDPPLIAPARWTIAHVARERGYRTACFGKWHLGWDWPINDEQEPLLRTGGYGGRKDLTASDKHRLAWREVFSQKIDGGPCTRGFDIYFGTDVPNWPPYCFIENDRTRGIPSEFANVALFRQNQASIQGPALAGWTLEPVLPTLVQRVTDYFAAAADSTDPFLIYLALTAPHTPLAVNEPWRGRSGLGPYGDFVMETDAAIGRVLEALESAGLSDNTLVLLTSDNGCAPYIGVDALEARGHFPSGPLRGYKSDAWEGGHRVPMIVRWPGVVKAGETCDQLVHQADLMATFAEVLKVSLPPDAGEDSFSMLPLLLGSQAPVRELAVSCSSSGLPSLRRHQWKLILGRGSGGWAKGGDEDPIQLYDLSTDVAETRNVYAQHPELVAEMLQLMDELIERGRSSAGPPQENDVAVRHFPEN